MTHSLLKLTTLHLVSNEGWLKRLLQLYKATPKNSLFPIPFQKYMWAGGLLSIIKFSKFYNLFSSEKLAKKAL